jgi:hypothetical protein
VGGAQAFQIDRALLRGEANRRTTMHNLEAALALVDRAHPNQSRLLTVPRKSHGGTAGPIFGPRQEQAFKHLVDWVAIVVPPPPEAPKPVAAVGTADSADVSVTQIDAGAAAAPPQDSVHFPTRRHSAVRAASATDDDMSMTLRTPHRLQLGAQLKSWQPRDDFDPEIFNRGQRSPTHADVPAAQSSTDAGAATAQQR